MPPYCEVDMPPYCDVDMPPPWLVESPPPCDVLRLRGHLLIFGIAGRLKWGPRCCAVCWSYWVGLQEVAVLARISQSLSHSRVGWTSKRPGYA